MPEISVGQAGIYAILGYAIVFIGLLALMFVITLLGKLFAQKKVEAPAVPEIVPPAPAVAPGTAGQLKLYNVDPKTAAMLMAIVANKMGKPINELRFLSIKEVSE